MIAYRDNEQVIIEIKKIMLDSKVSHREVAERIGLSPQAFNKLLNKKNFGFEPSAMNTHNISVENKVHYLPDKE